MVPITTNWPAMTRKVCPRSRRLSSASTWSGVRLRSSGGSRGFAMVSPGWPCACWMASGPAAHTFDSIIGCADAPAERRVAPPGCPGAPWRRPRRSFGRIADRFRVKRMLASGKIQGRGNRSRVLLPMKGVEPSVQPFRGRKEIDVLADEAGVHLGIVQLGVGHVDQGDSRQPGGWRAHLGAQITSDDRAQEVGLGIVDVNALGENDVEFNLLLVHG